MNRLNLVQFYIIKYVPLKNKFELPGPHIMIRFFLYKLKEF